MPHWISLWVIRRLAPVDWRWEDTLPNRITVWRAEAGVVGTLLFYAIYVTGSALWHSGIWDLFIVCMATVYIGTSSLDLLDGAVARWTNSKSLCGLCLDPIADKVTISASYPALLTLHMPAIWMCTIPVFIVYDLFMLGPININAAKKALVFAKLKQFFLFTGTGALLSDIYASMQAQAGSAKWQVVHHYAVNYGAMALFVAASLCGLAALVYVVCCGLEKSVQPRRREDLLQ